MTVKQLADALGVSKYTIHTWMQRGVVGGRLVRVPAKTRAPAHHLEFSPVEALRIKAIARSDERVVQWWRDSRWSR